MVTAGPSFGIGGPTTAAWREEALTKVEELSGLLSWLQANGAGAGDLPAAIQRHLEAARHTAAETVPEGQERPGWWTRMKSAYGGSSFERTLGNLDAAEVSLLRLASPEYLAGQLPSLHAHVNRYLPKDDPRREHVAAMTVDGGPVGTARDALMAAYHAANSQRRRDFIRLGSFRNWVAGATVVLAAAAIGVGVLGLLDKAWIPMCFFPEEQGEFVCPRQETAVGDGVAGADVDRLVAETARPTDLFHVELIGLIAAALAAALALRRMRGTSTPYGVPVALAVLKLPTGALTAVAGLLLMRGGFVPGLSALDSSAQILAWAFIFGYAQELLTRMIDSQAHGLLNDLSGHGAAGDRPKTTG